MTRPTLRPFAVHCAGLHYIAMAESACMAIINAMDLHGVHAATASPLVLA